MKGGAFIGRITLPTVRLRTIRMRYGRNKGEDVGGTAHLILDDGGDLLLDDGGFILLD